MQIFDLTEQIKLSPKLQKKYNRARLGLHIVFMLGAIFVAIRILFPSLTQDYSFSNTNSLKNTLVVPPIANADGTASAVKSTVPAGNIFSFNSNPFGNFSDVTVSLVSTSNLSSVNITVRKSYQAFFYPTGAPIGFKNGTLLTSNGAYYIISGGLLRKFASPDIILKFGYPKSAFINVSENDLKYNLAGPDVLDAVTYPDDTLFLIDNTFYELKNQQLLPFVSQRAFLSQFDATQAISKNQDFLQQYPQAENSIGFVDGTLASSDQSVYILSHGKSYPIENVETFLAMGFDFKNVIALDPEELGLYARQKQFTDDQPHPDGTLFFDQKNNQYYVIDAGFKRPILTQAIAQNYASKQVPVTASTDSLTAKISCQLKKEIFSDTYSCSMPLAQLNSLTGNDYKIDTKFASEVKIKEMHATFSTPLTWDNFKSALSNIKGNIKGNYVIKQ